MAIVGGLVLDGTGAAGVQRNILIDDGRITELSDDGAAIEARTVIDARNRVVTPGFIDPHTHMDAQLFWDPSGCPSLLHGVTSVVIGSCGIGIAPARPDMREYMLRSLESVEEIPYRSTALGVPLSWTTWAEYVTAIDALPLGLNVAALVPHNALRIGVLGPRGLADDLSGDEIGALVSAAEEAMEAGAVGLSSTRGTNHTDAYGDPVPSRRAGDDELAALAALCRGRVWQINIRAKGDASEAGRAAALQELRQYADWSERFDTMATWSPLVVGPGDAVVWRALQEYSSRRQGRLLAQVCPQMFCSTITFDGPSYASMVDGWSAPFAGYSDLNDGQKSERLRDESFRSALRTAPVDPSRITSPSYERWSVLVSPSAPELTGLTLSEVGERLERHPVDALLDLALSDQLRTVVRAPLSNLDQDEDAMRALITNPANLFGIGDAGAHVKSITNYTYPTFVLSTLTRDRGWLALPAAVERLTRQPARAFGFEGRGVLEAGAVADVCVIDLARLAAEPASIVNDLPGGSGRLHSGATGYDAVIVGGEVVVDHDRPTGRSPGRFLRCS
jgi:N-acyl-D-aspartate/D-glutamate deacylase